MKIDNNEHFLFLAFESFLENAPNMVFVKDKNLIYRAASRTFAQMVGFDSGCEILGKTDFDIFEHEFAQKYVNDDNSILFGGKSSENYIEPLPDKNGKKSFSATSKYAIRSEDGTIIGLYGISRDITAQLELEAERESGLMSRRMFDSVFEADLTENKMLRVEAAGWAEKLHGATGAPFTETVSTFAENYVHPDAKAQLIARYDLEHLKDSFALGADEFSHNEYVHLGGQGFCWVQFTSRIYHSRISNTLRITTFLRNIDYEIRRRQALVKKAATDVLTGLPNRESVSGSVRACLAEKNSGRHAMLFIDLDCFKFVNDNWGHNYGDKVLIETAEKLRKLFSGGEIYGRLGGDEFLVFLKDVPSRQAVEQTAQKIVNALPIHIAEDNLEVDVTCSIGIALSNGKSATLEAMYEQSDQAMYRAKELGRNQFYFYDDLT